MKNEHEKENKDSKKMSLNPQNPQKPGQQQPGKYEPSKQQQQPGAGGKTDWTKPQQPNKDLNKGGSQGGHGKF